MVASAAAAVADVKAGHFRSYDSSIKTPAKGEKPKPDNATFVHLVLRSEVGGALEGVDGSWDRERLSWR